MLFNSFEFWIFFAIVLVVYRLVSHRVQNRFLLVASYVFYGWWDWRFLSLLFFSTAVDYVVALKLSSLDDERSRKNLIVVSMAANLCLLGVFKYFGFFVESAADVLTALGFAPNLPSLRIILPVGISFYTFQSMSYTIDVYRRELEATRNFLDFALYVSFFPQLVAGPVERAQNLLPQVLAPRRVTRDDVAIGLYCILLGLFKKIVVADNMAIVANHIFGADPQSLTAPEVLLGVYAFAFQIYGDFAGYSLIAQGTARWMGFSLMDNFRHPYFALSPQDFWRRWHISLSTWLRDYLYIPLGGSRDGTWRTYRNLLTTMVLGGLWHGANWTFVVWGTLHGLWLAAHRRMREMWPASPQLTPWGAGIRMFVTFQIVCVTWLFFRADSVTQAGTFLSALLGPYTGTAVSRAGWGLLAVYVLPLLLFEAWVERRGDLFALVRSHWVMKAIVYAVIVFGLLWFPAPQASEFIYFQF